MYIWEIHDYRGRIYRAKGYTYAEACRSIGLDPNTHWGGVVDRVKP